LNKITAGRHYKGKYQEAAEAKQRAQRLKQKHDKKGAQDKLQRRRRYAELVSEMFPPQVDESKKKELESRVDKLNHPVKKYSERKKRASPSPPSGHPPGGGGGRRRGSDASDGRGGHKGHHSDASPPRGRERSVSRSPPRANARDDPLSVGMAPAARLSDWPAGTSMASSRGQSSHRQYSEPRSSVFADLSPGPVRLSVAPVDRGYGGGYGGGDEELGALEEGLQQQSAQSSAMMDNIMARLNALDAGGL